MVACDTIVLSGQVSDENDGVSSGPKVIVRNTERG